MYTFLLGSLVLFILLLSLKSFMRANPRLIAVRGEKALSWLIFAIALFFLATGRWFIALVLLPVLLAFTGLHILWNPFLPSLSAPRFRSFYLDMAADFRKRAFQARVREGQYKGRDLKDFSESELIRLFEEFADDSESCALLAAYLDRRHPRWREHAHANAHAGQSGARSSHALTEQEAYEILSLQEGATLEEIRKAHWRLMQKLHPDMGGSTWLAARINAAKDVLVKTHY
jgi:hypothetical protein